MRALGYPIILTGAFLVRQAMVGRAKDSATDAKDLSLAFLSGDMAEVSAVFSRKGETASFLPAAGEVATGGGATSLVEAMQDLGSKAKGYVWGASGPNYYDCSGLVWQAMRSVGIYNGPRFTTYTLQALAAKQGWPIVTTPTIGDLVLWPRKHVGVVTGNNQYYSARSRKSGIGFTAIDSTYPGSTPIYVRAR